MRASQADPQPLWRAPPNQPSGLALVCLRQARSGCFSATGLLLQHSARSTLKQPAWYGSIERCNRVLYTNALNYKKVSEKGDVELACESAPDLFQVSLTSSLPRILHATPVSDDISSHNLAAG